MFNLFKKEVQLYPFRHRWTVENVGWLVGGEGLEGWLKIGTLIKAKHGKEIGLQIWPNGRGIESQEYMGIEVGGWGVWLWGKVRVGEDDSTEREVECIVGQYRLDEYLCRSSLLESTTSLLEDGTITVCLEGVAWDWNEKFNPKKNLDLISTLLADVETSSSHFSFRLPSPQDYFTTEWEVEADEEQIKARSLDVEHLVELDEQTIVGVRLAPIANYDFLSLHLKLHQCRIDRLVMWCRVTKLGEGGEEVGSKDETAIWRRGEAKKLLDCFVFSYHLLVPYRLRLEVIRIEETTLVEDEDVIPEYNLLNYSNIFQHFSPSWKESAWHSRPPPLPLSLDNLHAKLVEMISLAQNGNPNITLYTTNITVQNSLLINSTSDFNFQIHLQLSQIAQQMVSTFNLSTIKVQQAASSTEHRKQFTFQISWYTTKRRISSLRILLVVRLPEAASAATERSQ